MTPVVIAVMLTVWAGAMYLQHKYHLLWFIASAAVVLCSLAVMVSVLAIVVGVKPLILS